MSEVYEPAEDSYLMKRALELKLPELILENADLKFLEVGCGSGINLKTASKLGVSKNNIIGLDINPEAVKVCSDLGFNAVESDLFSSFKGGGSVGGTKVPLKFDVIVFNPPYLPLDKKEPEESRLATTGGKKGNEVLTGFLKDVGKHLNEKGRVFVITSSQAGEFDFERFGFKFEEVKSEKMFFERIVVWELKRD